jgi:tripartite-type tricarboxylate transporter receptor subunit TctC
VVRRRRARWHAEGPGRQTQQEINASLADPKLKARFADVAGDPMPMTRAEFGRFIADETGKWAKLIRAAGIKVG